MESRPALEDRCVAFIDILGFRDLIQRMTEGDEELLKTIREALESILRSEMYIYDQEVRQNFSRTRQMTSFSDSIVISETQDAYFGVVLAAQSLYSRLLHEGILCRGAITCGKIYHSGRIVFGDGLVRAFELESKAAKYPRIIVTDDLQRRIAEGDAQSPFNIRFASMLVRDHDGLWFIDPFHSSSWPGYRNDENREDVTLRAFKNMRTRIIDGLNRAQQGNKLWVIAKHRWLAQRFNETLAAERRIEPDRIEL